MICGMRSDLLTLRSYFADQFPSVSQGEASLTAGQKNGFQSDGCCVAYVLCYVVNWPNKMEFHASSMSGVLHFNMPPLAFTDGVYTL